MKEKFYNEIAMKGSGSGNFAINLQSARKYHVNETAMCTYLDNSFLKSCTL